MADKEARDDTDELRELAGRAIAARQAVAAGEMAIPRPAPGEDVEITLLRAIAMPGSETLQALDRALRDSGSLALPTVLALSNEANWPATVWRDSAWRGARRELLVAQLKAQSDELVGALAFRAVAEDPEVMTRLAAGEFDDAIANSRGVFFESLPYPKGVAGRAWLARFLAQDDALEEGRIGRLFAHAVELGPEAVDQVLARMEEDPDLTRLPAHELVAPLHRLLDQRPKGALEQRPGALVKNAIWEDSREQGFDALTLGEVRRLFNRPGM